MSNLGGPVSSFACGTAGDPPRIADTGGMRVQRRFCGGLLGAGLAPGDHLRFQEVSDFPGVRARSS
jgi:hypothetical protein